MRDANNNFLRSPMERLVHVALKVAHNDGVFTYRLKDNDAGPLVGKRVRVTFKNRQETGIIVDDEPPALDEKIAVKDILEIIDDKPILTKEQFALIRFCATYYCNALGPTIHLAVPRNEKASRASSFKFGTLQKPNITLTAEQHAAVTAIMREREGAYLLEGVTGSGKTHVYISAAYQTLEEGRSVLILVPEISLTPQLVHRVQAALKVKAVVMHSNITPSKKRDAIFSLLSGDARLLIGARSALFAPLNNLGLIVVDEEHDGSLKQDEAPRYHARDLALFRAKQENARIVLGSATPSLESIVNTQKGKLTRLVLHDRFNKNQQMPTVTIVDLKERSRDVDHRMHDMSTTAGQKMCILSRPLEHAMKQTLANGKQVLLFLNQRGYAKFGVCYECGQMTSCPNCSVGLTYYQNRRTLLCHQCKHTEVASTICRNCLRDGIRFLGLGTERLEQEVRARFPEQITLRLDRDVARSQRRLETTLTAMHEQKADILIGTQLIAKGHDFQHVGLVGVICADIALSIPDFRAAEKTFQLLTQVAGRAGRGDSPGHAVIQTFQPEHPSIKYAQHHNVTDFVAEELFVRKQFLQPPFSRAALVRCEHTDALIAEDACALVRTILMRERNITLLGPAPSPIEKINNRFRFQCLILSPQVNSLHQALAHLQKDKTLGDVIAKKRLRFIVDVDPYNLS